MVRPLMFNMGGAESGLAGCGTAASVPLLQDTAESLVWTTLDMPYNGFLVVDSSGAVVQRVTGSTFPAVAPTLEAAIAAALP